MPCECFFPFLELVLLAISLWPRRAFSRVLLCTLLCCLLDGLGSVCTASGYGGHHLLAHASSPLPGSTCLIQQQQQCTTSSSSSSDDMEQAMGPGFCAAVYRTTTTAQTPTESPPHHNHNLHNHNQHHIQQQKAARILSSPPPAASAPSRSASALTLLQPIAAASYTLPSLMAPYANSTAAGE